MQISIQKHTTNKTHFNIFIIKIFTYKMAYKHYLQKSEQGCLQRHRKRHLYTQKILCTIVSGRDEFKACGEKHTFPIVFIRRSRGWSKEKIGTRNTLQLFP